MKLSEVDKRILKVLEEKENSSEITTYRLAKEAEISWATAISHCYKLKSYGIIEGRPEKPKFGDKETMIWWLLHE
jgi:DNA-binding Lrp family transcriptional regulator